MSAVSTAGRCDRHGGSALAGRNPAGRIPHSPFRPRGARLNGRGQLPLSASKTMAAKSRNRAGRAGSSPWIIPRRADPAGRVGLSSHGCGRRSRVGTSKRSRIASDSVSLSARLGVRVVGALTAIRTATAGRSQMDRAGLLLPGIVTPRQSETTAGDRGPQEWHTRSRSPHCEGGRT